MQVYPPTNYFFASYLVVFLFTHRMTVFSALTALHSWHSHRDILKRCEAVGKYPEDSRSKNRSIRKKVKNKDLSQVRRRDEGFHICKRQYETGDDLTLGRVEPILADTLLPLVKSFFCSPLVWSAKSTRASRKPAPSTPGQEADCKWTGVYFRYCWHQDLHWY